MSVKIVIIALQKFLDLDQIIIARTAPGHSLKITAEKINCVLNLGLYGIGCMRQRSSNAKFEFEIAKCDTLSEQRNLVEKNSENEALFAETCAPCINLIKQNFEQLSLKDEKFICLDSASSRDIDELFNSLKLNHDLAAHDGANDLKNRPKLSQYLQHCCRERIYFFSAKKCGNKDCLTCGPPRLADDDFMRLKLLPDPMPSDDSKHCKAFDEVIGNETDESHMPSLKTTKNRKHNITFNPLQQHTLNTRLVIECSKCDKPRIVFAKKNLLLKR